MDRVVVSESVSIAGVMDAAGRAGHPHGAWTMPYRPDDLGGCAAAELLAAGTLLLGRVTYRGSPGTWPTGHESTTVRGEMRAAVQALKDRRGADALVVAGATLAHGLLGAELVDELRLEVYPVALGIGTRLSGVASRLDFKLAESTQAPTGVMLLTYRCARASAESVALLAERGPRPPGPSRSQLRQVDEAADRGAPGRHSRDPSIPRDEPRRFRDGAWLAGCRADPAAPSAGQIVEGCALQELTRQASWLDPRIRLSHPSTLPPLGAPAPSSDAPTPRRERPPERRKPGR